MARRNTTTSLNRTEPAAYGGLVSGISDLLEQARRGAARAINNILTTTYWEIGRRIVEFEQGGKARAEYGEALLVCLAGDLTAQYGRGFSKSNLFLMRGFFLGWEIFQTVSGIWQARMRVCDAIFPTVSGISAGVGFPQTQPGPLNTGLVPAPAAQLQGKQLLEAQSAKPDAVLPCVVFPLSWSHYVRLMSVEKPQARVFYESEAIRGGWSVRQLDRQISTQFFERASNSKQPATLLARGQKPKPEDAVSVEDVEDVVRDPYVLEFLNLKDEYSESELEDGLIMHLEAFLLELGTGFTFVARQKRIRI